MTARYEVIGHRLKEGVAAMGFVPLLRHLGLGGDWAYW